MEHQRQGIRLVDPGFDADVVLFVEGEGDGVPRVLPRGNAGKGYKKNGGE